MQENTKGFGFTLIEMLVVISVIGILAALSIFSFSPVQTSVRDSQRKTDLKQYSASLEIFADNNNNFYTSRSIPIILSPGANLLCTDLSIDQTLCHGDPKASNSKYFYKYDSDGTGNGAKNATKYVLWTKLESVQSYWVICSSNKTGLSPISSWTDPISGVCPI